MDEFNKESLIGNFCRQANGQIISEERTHLLTTPMLLWYHHTHPPTHPPSLSLPLSHPPPPSSTHTHTHTHSLTHSLTHAHSHTRTHTPKIVNSPKLVLMLLNLNYVQWNVSMYNTLLWFLSVAAPTTDATYHIPQLSKTLILIWLWLGCLWCGQISTVLYGAAAILAVSVVLVGPLGSGIYHMTEAFKVANLIAKSALLMWLRTNHSIPASFAFYSLSS